VLQNLKLDYFKAEPDHIGPFGAPLLSWSVSWDVDPPPKVNVDFFVDGQPVGMTGKQLVQPPSSHTYLLSARYRAAFGNLGQAAINVDLSKCRIQEIFPLDSLLPPQIQQMIVG
jgi:hypothetical protein